MTRNSSSAEFELRCLKTELWYWLYVESEHFVRYFATKFQRGYKAVFKAKLAWFAVVMFVVKLCVVCVYKDHAIRRRGKLPAARQVARKTCTARRLSPSPARSVSSSRYQPAVYWASLSPLTAAELLATWPIWRRPARVVPSVTGRQRTRTAQNSSLTAFLWLASTPSSAVGMAL